MSSTLLLPGDDFPMVDPDEISDRLGNQVDIIIDGGICGVEPTSVLDLTSGSIEIIRKGKGDLTGLEV
jgi:tRNA A37 threonylcarbamoyladenosine synthetase subunit TsaC/SUA5/YrdC